MQSQLLADGHFSVSMDPLSAAASIVGLNAAVGKVYRLLNYVSSIKNAPATIRDAKDQVGHAKLALKSMEGCLDRLASLSPDRTALIQVDDLRITLADAMMAFSDFENLLQKLADVRTVVSWYRHEKSIQAHMARVERYQSSLNMMLNILQCETQLEASKSQERLQAQIKDVLDDNQRLRRLMNESRDSFDARSMISERSSDDRFTIQPGGGDEDEDDAATIRGIDDWPVAGSFETGLGVDLLVSPFERVLEQSWVYKRSQPNECDRSFISSAVRPHAWSVFSGISLADVSILSVIAMPLTSLDITNSKHYKVEIKGDLWASSLQENKLQETDGVSPKPLTMATLGPDDFKTSWTLPLLEEEPETSLEDETHSPAKLFEEQDEMEDTQESGDSPSAPEKSPEFDEAQHEKSSDANDKIDNGNDDDKLNTCRGCKEEMQIFKGYEFAGMRWHFNCFRCMECHGLLNADSDFFIAGADSLICVECSHDCEKCGKKIQDRAIFAGSRTFCKACFTCMSCGCAIQDSKYARTSGCLLCIPCHDRVLARQSQVLGRRRQAVK